MRLHEAILGVAEVIGRPLSDAAVAIMARELSKHPPEAVADALRRCATECRHRLTLADVFERMPGSHPGPEEAWSIASRAYDEAASVVWTPEIAQAFDEVRHLEPIAGRMAFKEAYRSIVAGETDPPRWQLSPGHDPAQRAAAVEGAVARGRLPAGVYADVVDGSRRLPRGCGTILPANIESIAPVSSEEAAALGREAVKALSGGGSSGEGSERVDVEERRRRLQEQAEQLRAASGNGGDE